jgi:PKD repeat protein
MTQKLYNSLKRNATQSFFTIVFCFFTLSCFCQGACDPMLWPNSVICGSIPAAGVGVTGGNVFCEGDSVRFVIPNTFDIDSAIICWGNGRTTVLYGPGVVYEVYDYPDDTCITATNSSFTSIEFSISAILIKNCALGRSVTKLTNSITVFFPPKAEFIVPSVCTNENVPINNLSCTNSANAQWAWTAVGSTISGANTKNPMISYANPGNYTITLTITTPGAPAGCNSSTFETTIAVGPPATAICTVPPLVCVGIEVVPVNNSQNGVAPPGQSPYLWSQISGPANGMMFVFPSLPTDKEPRFKFTIPGTYQIRLSVKGCHNPDTVVTIIVRDKPTATLTLPTGQCAPYSLIINQSNSPINTGGFPETEMTYSWLITRPDGSQLTYSTKYPPAITCDIPGVYTITFKVSNGCQPPFTVTKTLTINARPKAIISFTPPPDSCIGVAPLTLQFNSNSTGTNLTLVWSITGPGASINPMTGVATFTQPGTFTVTLKATNTCPAPNSDTKTVTLVLFAPPKINNLTLPATCEGNNMTLANSNLSFSNGNLPCNCTWTFENGTPSPITLPCSQLPPPVSFNGIGPHKVRVTITNKCGTDFKEVVLTLGQKPVPNFSMNLPTKPCAPFALTCTNTSAPNSTGTITYLWELVNDIGTVLATSNLNNPTFNIATSGTYTIRLTVTNTCGSNTTEKSFTAFAAPSGILEVTGSGCGFGSPEIALNIITSGGSALLAPEWSFTGGMPATGIGMDPTPPLYNQYGTYPIIATLDNGFCKTTLTQNFTVTAIPEANVTLAQRPRCLPVIGYNLVFNLPSKPGVKYAWKLYRKTTPSDPFTIWKTSATSSTTALVQECGIYSYELTASNICDTVVWTAVDTFFTQPIGVVPLFPFNYCQQAVLDFNGPDIFNGCNNNLKFWWEFPEASPTISYDMHPQDITFSSPNVSKVFTYHLYLIGCEGDTIHYSGTVNIDAPQVLVLGPSPLVLCKNATPVSLNANLPGGKWFLNGVEVTDGKVHPENLAPGVYIYVYKKASGTCTSEGSLEVTIFEQPTVDAGSGLVVCLGDQYVVRTPQVATGNSGIWTSTHPNIQISGDTIRFSSALSTNLRYTVTDAQTGCTNTQIISLTVLSNALSPAPPTLFALCYASGDIALPLTNVHSTLRYYGQGVLADSIHFDPALIPVGQTQTTVQWYNVNSAGCELSGEILINIEQLLQPGVLLAGVDAEICQNASQPFTRLGLPSSNTNLTWLSQNGVQLSNTGLLTINPALFQKDTILMLILAHRHGTLNCGQYDTTYLHIRYAAPDAGVLQTACLNEDSLLLVSGNMPTNGYSAYWTDMAGNTITSILPADLGVGLHPFQYHFEGFGCIFNDVKNIEIYPLSGAHFSIVNATCANHPFVFLNDTPLGINWEWYDNGQLFSTQKTPLNQVFTPGFHTIKLISYSNKDCQDEYEKIVFVESPPTLVASLDKTEGCGPVLPVEVTYVSTAQDQLFFQIKAPGVTPYLVEATGSPQIIELAEGLFNLEYTLTLLAINECDSAIAVFKVTVFASSSGQFSIHKDTFCSGELNNILSNSINSLGDTVEIRVQNQVIQKIPVGNGLLVPFQIFTQIPLQAQACMVSTGKCNEFIVCRDILIIPNEFKALIEVNFPNKVCAGTSIPMIGHVTTGATAEWQDQYGNIRLGDTIWVNVKEGLNQWTLYARGCGYDSMTVAFTGIAPLPIKAIFDPIACLGQEIAFDLASPGAELLTIFSNLDSIYGSTPEYVFDTFGQQSFRIWARSPEECLRYLDTFIQVQPLPIISFKKIRNCTQELGVTLMVDNPNDEYSMKLSLGNSQWTSKGVFNQLQPGLYTLAISEGPCGLCSEFCVKIVSYLVIERFSEHFLA